MGWLFLSMNIYFLYISGKFWAISYTSLTYKTMTISSSISTLKKGLYTLDWWKPGILMPISFVMVSGTTVIYGELYPLEPCTPPPPLFLRTFFWPRCPLEDAYNLTRPIYLSRPQIYFDMHHRHFCSIMSCHTVIVLLVLFRLDLDCVRNITFRRVCSCETGYECICSSVVVVGVIREGTDSSTLPPPNTEHYWGTALRKLQ